MFNHSLINAVQSNTNSAHGSGFFKKVMGSSNNGQMISLNYARLLKDKIKCISEYKNTIYGFLLLPDGGFIIADSESARIMREQNNNYTCLQLIPSTRHDVMVMDNLSEDKFVIAQDNTVNIWKRNRTEYESCQEISVEIMREYRNFDWRSSRIYDIKALNKNAIVICTSSPANKLIYLTAENGVFHVRDNVTCGHTLANSLIEDQVYSILRIGDTKFACVSCDSMSIWEVKNDMLQCIQRLDVPRGCGDIWIGAKDVFIASEHNRIIYRTVYNYIIIYEHVDNEYQLSHFANLVPTNEANIDSIVELSNNQFATLIEFYGLFIWERDNDNHYKWTTCYDDLSGYRLKKMPNGDLIILKKGISNCSTADISVLPFEPIQLQPAQNAEPTRCNSMQL